MATGRLQPLALIDKCIGSRIWVVMKVLISCAFACLLFLDMKSIYVIILFLNVWGIYWCREILKLWVLCVGSTNM